MTNALMCDVASNWETCSAVWLITFQDAVAPCDRHVVHHPLLHVVLMDPVVQESNLLLVFFFLVGVIAVA